MFKIISSLILSLFILMSSTGTEWADSFDPTTFPQIGVEEQAEGTTRVASFNVRYADVNGVSAVKRTHLVLDQIKEIAPDSIGVQEATPFWCFVLDTGLTGYKRVGVGRNDGTDGLASGEHSSILYNTEKLKLLDQGTFWFSDTPDTPSTDWEATLPRICSWAVLQYKDSGVTYVHMNAHFDNESVLSRANSAKLLVSYAKEHFTGMNLIITGDFNSVEWETETYGYVADNFTDAEYTATDSVSYGSYNCCDPAVYDDANLDHIFMSDEVTASVFRTVTTGIDGRLVSDHFPIYADVVLSADADGYSGGSESILSQIFGALGC